MLEVKGQNDSRDLNHLMRDLDARVFSAHVFRSTQAVCPSPARLRDQRRRGPAAQLHRAGEVRKETEDFGLPVACWALLVPLGGPNPAELRGVGRQSPGRAGGDCIEELCRGDL